MGKLDDVMPLESRMTLADLYNGGPQFERFGDGLARINKHLREKHVRSIAAWLQKGGLEVQDIEVWQSTVVALAYAKELEAMLAEEVKDS